jgi:hypothetical protein
VDGIRLAFVVEVEVVVGGDRVVCMLDRTESLVSIPACEGY